MTDLPAEIHVSRCRRVMFGPDHSCSCPTTVDGDTVEVPPCVYNAIDIPMRCDVCKQTVGTCSVRWDGFESAMVETNGELHEDLHLEGCSIGDALRSGITRGVSIDMDEAP